MELRVVPPKARIAPEGERESGPAEARPGEPSPALLEGARRGNRSAQQELVLSILPRVRARVGRLLGPDDEREDVVQNVCIELLRSLKRYRGDATFGLWVDRIASHVVYKHFRGRRRRRLRFVLDQAPDRGSHLDSGPGLDLARALEEARQLIDELNPERRIVFLLVALEGHTMVEVAGLLDLGLPAVKARYLRARRELDRKLEKRPALCAVLQRQNGAGS